LAVEAEPEAPAAGLVAGNDPNGALDLVDRGQDAGGAELRGIAVRGH
jgi:hypothetical protein